MMCTIKWLNDNAGACTVLLTLILVMANIAFYIINKLQLKLLKEQNKPILSISLEGIKGDMFLKLINYGNNPAINVKIQIDKYLLTSNRPEEQTDYLKALNTGGGLWVEKSKPMFISLFHSFSEIEKPFVVKVEYSDYNKQKYTEEVIFDTSSLMYVSHRDHDELEHINTLKSIAESLSKIAKK